MKRLPSIREIATSSPTSTSRRSRSRSCRPSTTRWAASRPTSTARSWRRRTATRTRSSTASTRSANAPASPCTAPTASAPTRCSTCSCSAARPATTSSRRPARRESQQAAAGRRRRPLARAPGAPRRRDVGGEYAQDVANDIRATMQAHCGVFRNAGAARRRRRARSRSSRERVQRHRARGQEQGVQHRARRGARVDNLIETAKATIVSAAARQECRGAHGDDEPTIPNAATTSNWLKHTLWYQRRQPPRLQAGQPEAADGRIDSPGRAYVLTRQGSTSHDQAHFRIYRYDPEKDAKPYMQDYDVALDAPRPHAARRADPAQGDRRRCRSAARCREGVCGSDAMNINGKNGLACITNLRDAEGAGRAAAAARPARDPRPDRRHEPVLQAVPLDQAVPGQRHAAAREGAPAVARGARGARRPVRVHPVRVLLDVLPVSSGGTRTSSSARPACCRPIASSPTAATRPPTSASTTSRIRTACSAATRS